MDTNSHQRLSTSNGRYGRLPLESGSPDALRTAREEEALRCHRSSPRPIQTLAPSSNNIHPIDQEIIRIHPPNDLTANAEIVWRMKSFQIMIAHLESLSAAAASNPDLFELRGPPSRIFKKGDEIDCYGMLEGIWRIVEKKKRSHRWDITSTAGPEEWAYILVRDETTGQEAILKMAARYFHPTTLVIQMRKTIHKVKSALTLRSPTRLRSKKSGTHDEGL